MRALSLCVLACLFGCRKEAAAPFAADWSAQGEAPLSSFGHRAMGLGDVNGDGYGDFMVTAPDWNRKQGRAYVFHGGPKGPAASPDWVSQGLVPGDFYGDRGGQAGDLNGDGFADAFVSAPAWNSGLGRVHVYHGSARGLGAKAAWEFSPQERGEQFGDCTHPSGDLNGDGYDDLAVGAFGHDKDRGRVLLFLGGARGLASEPAWEGRGQSEGEQFGYSPGAAGDLDGDGIADLLVGAKFARGKQDPVGRVYAYRGAKDGRLTLAATLWGRDKDGQFGARVHGMGDLDGDGFGDALISAPGASKVYLYHGAAQGFRPGPARVIDGAALGLVRFGLACAPAGDLDGDGTQEWMAYGADQEGLGQVLLFQAGRELGRWKGGTLGGRFGSWCAPAGDLNGDGAPDWLVSDPSDSSKGSLAGAVFLRLGRTPLKIKQKWDAYLPMAENGVRKIP